MAKTTNKTSRTGERESPLLHVEIPLYKVFTAAAAAVERLAESRLGSTVNYYCSMSGALRSGITEVMTPERDYGFFAVSEFHRELCSSKEFMSALTQYGAREAVYNWRGDSGLTAFNKQGMELLIVYFTLLAEYARDIGLTYLLDAEVGTGQFWCNSSSGPQLWK